MSISGGGKAAAGGIGFQQRVGGFFLALAGLQLRLDELLNLPDIGAIDSIRFETSDAVDDLCLTTNEGRHCYCQIKRTLSLSASAESEFGSVVDQCVRQFTAHDANTSDVWVLIVSPSASRQVAVALQRILNAVRQSPEQFTRVPFNQDERKALAALESLFGEHYLKRLEKAHNAEVFAEFCKKMFVVSLDIDRHGVQENAILALLLSRLHGEYRETGSAWNIWHKCVVCAAEYASTRAIVAAETIRSLFARQLDNPPGGDRVHWDSQMLQSGLEVLLVESFDNRADYLATDIVRFSDDGSKRLRFIEEHVEIAPGGPTVRVVFRSATWQGLEKFLLEQPDILADKSLVVIEARLNSDPNITSAATNHTNIVEQMLKERSGVSCCIHCGRAINQSSALLIEVDEERLPFAVGTSHNHCRRPTDRVFGRVEIRGYAVPELLRDFDLSAWARAVVKGQRGLQESLRVVRQRNRLMSMIWTPESLTTSFGTWCLNVTLADGSTRIVRSRSRVERMGRDEAEKKAQLMNEWIQQASIDADPFCYSQSGAFGTRRSLEREYPSQELIECKTVEVIKYSTIVESSTGDWYAPLCFITERKSDRICVLGNEAVPLFSNPLQVSEMLENWASMGFEVGDVRVHAILTDAEFDLQCRQWLEEGLYLVVDPHLGNGGQLKQALAIMDQTTVLRTISDGEGNQQCDT